MYKLRNWVDKRKLVTSELYMNCRATSLLEVDLTKPPATSEFGTGNGGWLYGFPLSAKTEPGKMALFNHWRTLSKNVDQLHLFRHHPQRILESEWDIFVHPDIDWLLDMYPEHIHINWTTLSRNPSHAAIRLLEKHLDKINWPMLSRNPAAMHLLEQHPDKICWANLSYNPSHAAIRLLEKHLDKINWKGLSKNPAAMHLLEQHPDKIDWSHLSANPAAISLLEQNPQKISWFFLSANPAGIHLCEKYPDKIERWGVTRNPEIFEYDYEGMMRSKRGLHEELIAERFHPRNIERFAGWGFEVGW